MVVVSLLVIVISGALLAFGIVSGDDSMVVGSITLSLVAAVILFIGVWRQRSPEAQTAEESESDAPAGVPPTARDDWRVAYDPDRSAAMPSPLGSPIDELTGELAVGDPHQALDLEDNDYEPEAQQPGQEPETVTSADPATRARSAVASISKRPVDDSEDLLMQDRRVGVSDAATAIPQLMSTAPPPAAPPTPPAAEPAPAAPPAPPVPPAPPEPPAASEITGSSSAFTGRAQTRSAVPPTAAPGFRSEPRSYVSSEFSRYRAEAESVQGESQPASSPAVPEAIASEPAPTESHRVKRTEEAEEVSPPAAVTAPAQRTEEPDEPQPPANAVEAGAGAPAERETAESDDEYADPADEPPAELLLSYEERQLRDCDAQVFVVDGRPRFHLEGCLHLADKRGEPLVLSEAAELGFTSCSLCTAATTVLAARR